MQAAAIDVKSAARLRRVVAGFAALQVTAVHVVIASRDAALIRKGGRARDEEDGGHDMAGNDGAGHNLS